MPRLVAVVFAILVAFSACARAEAEPVAAALAESTRPDAERQQDEERKPQELMALANVRPGLSVMDLVPHDAYFTRLFATIVGPSGHVYDFVPSEADEYLKRLYPSGLPILDADHHNVSNIHTSLSKLVAPEFLDIVWSFRNYHNFHSKFFGPADMGTVNKAIYNALKPGGFYVVVDNAARTGAGLSECETLHRIDKNVVKREAMAAGFKLAGESQVLRSARDDRASPAKD